MGFQLVLCEALNRNTDRYHDKSLIVGVVQHASLAEDVFDEVVNNTNVDVVDFKYRCKVLVTCAAWLFGSK